MIQKNIFRNEIKEILLEDMVKGIIKPGERLSLPKIAEKLEVSVTPIREALTQLTETSIVTYKANRGFFVTELTIDEALEIYEIIALLESEAISKSTYNQKHLDELTKINQKFKRSKDPKEKLRFDRSFHQKLISNYTNQYAQKIIEDVRIRIFIYELAYMSEVSNEQSHEMHQQIITYLASGNKKKAAELVKSNWDISINHINQHFQSTNP